MTTTTPTTALADLPEHRLDYIARQYFADEQYQQYVKHAISDAFHEARRAAQPVAPVQAMLADALREIFERRPCDYALDMQKVRDADMETLMRVHHLFAAPSPQIAEVAELEQQLRAAANRPTMPGREPGSVLVHASLLRIAADAIAASRRAAWGAAPQQLRAMRAAFHASMLRAFPDKTHDEITAEIDRAVGVVSPAPASAVQAAPALPATHRAIIEEAAQVLESAAAHNRANGRTVLERTQQDRADRLRLILAAQPAEGAGQAGQVAGEAIVYGGKRIERAHLAEPERDAVRYRWLRSQETSLESQQRDKSIVNGPSCYHEVEGVRELKWGTALDEAIDAARAANTESAAAPADLEQQLIERRIGLTPENEGGWHAHIYGDSEVPVTKGYGETPRDAVHNATHQALGGDAC